MKSITVICDACNKNLSEPDYIASYRIVLSCEKNPTGSVMAALYLSPEISEPHHFCHMKCLASWMKANTNCL
jgi:hypothetical protein